MKKRAFLWALAFLFCFVRGVAEGEAGRDEGALSVKLEGFEVSDGMASMALRFESPAPQPLRIYLIEPCLNGAPATFLNGWNTDEITVAPGSSDRVDITLCAGHPGESPETVSLRFAANGAISSPMIVRRSGDGVAVTEPVLDPVPPEPGVMSNRLTPARASASERRILSDRLSADERVRLEYGRAVIGLLETEGGEDRFVRFCTLPVRVHEDGTVYADYSGYAVTASAAPDFPLSTVEEVQDGQRLFRVSHIVLAGEAAFYADLAFEVRQSADGRLSLGACTIRSEELGGAYRAAPLSLFSELRSSNAVLSLGGREGGADAEIAGDRFISVPMEQPLDVELKPASELGKVYAYFEYFFSDNRKAVHPPFPV